MPLLNLILLIVIVGFVSIYIDRRWIRNRGKAKAAATAPAAPAAAAAPPATPVAPAAEEKKNGSA